jgi:hypothetical protein
MKQKGRGYFRLKLSVMLRLICLLLLTIVPHITSSQSSDRSLRHIFGAIVFISDSLPSYQEINGKTYRVIFESIDGTKTIKKPILKTGSGFIVIRGVDVYLVTAEHVAMGITKTSTISFRNSGGKTRTIKILELLGNKEKEFRWIVNDSADVAVMHLGNEIVNNNLWITLGLSAIPYYSLNPDLISPDRLTDLTVFGFPLGLGVNSTKISPITKTLRPASDIIKLPRADTKKDSDFFVLDDPSISGFSGGPVMRVISLPRTGDPEIDSLSVSATVFGLVHGTVNDKTGGFALIVPSKFIKETIDKFPGYTGKYTIQYGNGKLWSEREYKNGSLWNVISNFNPKGKPQDKGTLLNGNGFVNIYNEKGELIWREYYKDGEVTNTVYIGKTMNKSE